MMNLPPEFLLKNTPEPIAPDEIGTMKIFVPTGRRIIRSFDGRVVWWAALTILVFCAFLGKPFLLPAHVSLLVDWLYFAVGLMVGLVDSALWRKHNTTNPPPLWIRFLVLIAILVAAFSFSHFLASNNVFFSLCEGGLTGSFIWRSVATYRSNWISLS
jgi:hypothetical protein